MDNLWISFPRNVTPQIAKFIGPTSGPDGHHVGPMNLAIRDSLVHPCVLSQMTLLELKYQDLVQMSSWNSTMSLIHWAPLLTPFTSTLYFCRWRGIQNRDILKHNISLVCTWLLFWFINRTYYSDIFKGKRLHIGQTSNVVNIWNIYD